MQTPTRRQFLKKASAAAGATVLAAPAIARAAASPNARIRVAVVGLGGRGRHSHCGALYQMVKDNVEIAALSDCDENRMKSAAQDVEKNTGRKPVLAADMRKLLEDKSIDAVAIASPNHWHGLQTIWACQAGKDVYVEKPASHNVCEGRKMVEAARKYGRMVQVGTQCRSSPKIREGIEKLKQGVIGRVYMARGIAYKLRAGGRNEIGPVPPGVDWDLWLGPAPKTAYNRLAVYRWRFLKEYGNGELGDQGVHQLDIIRWGLGLQTHPSRIQSMGANNFHPTSDEDTPAQQTMACKFAGRDEGRDLVVQFETRDGYTNDEAGMGTKYEFVDHRNVVGVIFFGTEGYLIIPDYSSYHTFLGPNRKPGPSAAVPGAPMMDLDHFQNWIAAVRSRDAKSLYCDIEEGHLSAAICHLANVACTTGRTLQFDPKAERFLGDDEADKLLTRPYRAPYLLPEQV
jgi:predicted dehydrogenase